MRYSFPVIEHADQIREAIQGRDEFIEANRGDHVIFEYNVSMPDTFPDPMLASDEKTSREWALRRECRGLIMDKTTGRVLARSYQKFFNANEKPETQIDKIDLSEPHVILEKLDGSMIRPYFPSGGQRLIWGTRMGDTDVAKQAQAYLADCPLPYEDFAYLMIRAGVTPNFEWCRRKQRIVIDYPEDCLILIAIRNNRTGTYWRYDQMKNLARDFGLPVVESWTGTARSITEFSHHVRDLENLEGYVVRFHTGHMFKLKADWYVRIHRAKDMLALEKNVIEMILSGSQDDVLALLPPEEHDRLTRYSTSLLRAITEKAKELHTYVSEARTRVRDKKAFAEAIMARPRLERGLLFQIWDGRVPFEVVKNFVLKHTTTQTRVDEIRPLLGGLDWADFK